MCNASVQCICAMHVACAMHLCCICNVRCRCSTEGFELLTALLPINVEVFVRVEDNRHLLPEQCSVLPFVATAGVSGSGAVVPCFLLLVRSGQGGLDEVLDHALYGPVLAPLRGIALKDDLP